MFIFVSHSLTLTSPTLTSPLSASFSLAIHARPPSLATQRHDNMSLSSPVTPSNSRHGTLSVETAVVGMSFHFGLFPSHFSLLHSRLRFANLLHSIDGILGYLFMGIDCCELDAGIACLADELTVVCPSGSQIVLDNFVQPLQPLSLVRSWVCCYPRWGAKPIARTRQQDSVCSFIFVTDYFLIILYILVGPAPPSYSSCKFFFFSLLYCSLLLMHAFCLQ